MTTNPHLDMANDVFARMFGLQISPVETAEKLVADYSRADPIDAHEAENGMVAGLMSDNRDIEVSESAFYPLTDAQIEEGHQTEIRR